MAFHKTSYAPQIEDELFRMNGIIINSFETDTYDIWTTQWLNEFTIHQVVQVMIIVETEKDIVESFFHCLRDRFSYRVFISHSKTVMQRYVLETENPIIVKNLISKSLIQKNPQSFSSIPIPKIEKILVDLFCDKEIFLLYQGHELVHIFQNAFQNYTIDNSMLFKYAQKRKQQNKLENFISHYVFS